jgi:uncharacterized SAM-binding protein YcdF (DUF218 family)
MFILKKLLGNLMMPLSFSLVLLLLGLLLLWFSQRRSRKQFWGKLFISLGTALLLVSSLPFTSVALNSPLERSNPPLYSAPTGLQYVVVLGHGHRSDPFLPPRQQLSSASYYRLMEGLRLMQANPGATLLLSGYGGSDPVSNAHLYRVVAREYGIPAARIELFEEARDTAEEVALIAPLIKDHKSALVTSASHMPRALGLFHARGAEPIPSPTLFIAKQPQNPLFFYERLPAAAHLSNFTTAWHEIVGSLWQKIRD